MKKPFYKVAKVSLICLLLAAGFNLSSQNRGATSCPDFSSDVFRKKSSFKKNLNKVVVRFVKFINKSDNIVKITLLANGFAVSSSTQSVEIANGDTAVNDTLSKFNAGDFNKYGGGVLINYERKIYKTSSIQLSFGYYHSEYAGSFSKIKNQYSTDTKAIFGTETVSSGISSNAFVFTGQYKYYFKPHLRKFYLSPYIITKTGKSSFVDAIKTKDKNDFDFLEKSLMVGGGFWGGCQFLIRQKFAIDIFLGPEFRWTQVYGRKFSTPGIAQKDFLKKHDNDFLMRVYDKNGIGIRGNISLGYKFGKTK